MFSLNISRTIMEFHNISVTMLHCNRKTGRAVNVEFGHRLYLTGIGTEVTVPELREFLQKYTQKMPNRVDRVDLNTALPAYVIGFQGLVDGQIQQFSDRINGVYWHGHQLAAHVI